MIFLQQLACICQLAACITGDDTLGQIADLISVIADLVWTSVCACIQTQHKVQLDERDLAGSGTGGMASNQPPLPVRVNSDRMYEKTISIFCLVGDAATLCSASRIYCSWSLSARSGTAWNVRRTSSVSPIWLSCYATDTSLQPTDVPVKSLPTSHCLRFSMCSLATPF